MATKSALSRVSLPTPTASGEAATKGYVDTTAVLLTARGAASGVASLDSSTLVPIAQVPTGTSGTTVALGNHTHAITALTGTAISSPVVTQGLVYNGTNWANADLGIAKVASLATITSPITGQLAVLTSDGKLYRYNGSAWRIADGMGGRWRQDTTGQSIPATTDTKVTFNSALDTAAGISYAAGVFTVADAGKWDISASLVYPYTASLETWLWLGPSSATTTRWDLDVRVAPAASGPGTTLRTRVTRVFAASDTFALWTWHNSGTAKTLDVGYGGVTHLEATYVGPG